MYTNRFDTKNSAFFPTRFGLLMVFTINRDYFCMWHSPIGLTEASCVLCEVWTETGV